MAKTNRSTVVASTLPAFDANVLFGTVIAAVVVEDDGDAAQAVAAEYLTGRTLFECVQTYRAGGRLATAAAAGRAAAVTAAKQLLADAGVALDDLTPVRKALFQPYWTANEQTGKPTTKGAGGKTLYQSIYMQTQRMAEDITGIKAGKTDPEAVAVAVPRALQKELDTIYARLTTLRAEHAKDVMAQGRANALDKAKAAAAKAKAEAEAAAAAAE